ncbi:hypothetical protein M1615_03855 [Patescibacteria group bacterium]|nr:hypothetical protein [Patescibacteria group bacterium]MCL5010407.1 hypothetical protein [Patescibacteria group bacterium]
MSQIRLNKTPEIEEVLAFLRSRYRVLSEAEIIKVALAEQYKKEISELPLVDEETEKMIAKGMNDYKKGRYTVLSSDEDIDKHLDSL